MTRIVPETPTDEMLEAMQAVADENKMDLVIDDELRALYTAMIQAAPVVDGQVSSISTAAAIEAQARKALLEELIERAENIRNPFNTSMNQHLSNWLRSVLEEE